jgi:hypothetical protein
LIRDALRLAKRNKLIEQSPFDKGPKVAPHPDIGVQTLGSASLEPKRVLGIDRHQVFHTGPKNQPRFVRFVLDVHLDRQERRVIDPDPNLFDRRDENITVSLLAQNRCE